MSGAAAAGIRYVIGDATSPLGPGPKVIAHVCNDAGGWGRGFVVAISRRWPEPEQRYRVWHASPPGDLPFELGRVQFVEVVPELWVANMIGQHGTARGGRKPDGGAPVRYDAIRRALSVVGEFAKQRRASVHMPRIARGLAGGSWDEIEPIIRDTLVAAGIEAIVYDLPAALDMAGPAERRL